MEYLISDFPREAIEACTGPGPADEAVEYWVNRLDFRPDPDATRACLREYGAWDEEQLADDEENRRRLFWVMMCEFGEWDGLTGGESNYGADMFYVG